MNLIEHISELKTRLIWALVIMLISCVITAQFTDEILQFLVQPLINSNALSAKNLQFLGVEDGFMLFFKITLLSGVLLAFPIIAFVMAGFVNPALYDTEKRVIRPYIIWSPILFFLGAFFAYSVVIPNAWDFFLSFNYGSENFELSHNITAQKYLSLSINFIFVFALAAQLPIILLILIKLEIIEPNWLRSKRRYAFILSFIASAILTPPDIVSQISLALPIYLLFEISILLGNKVLAKT